MARIPTQLTRVTNRTNFDQLGAVGPGGATDFSGLIKGATDIVNQSDTFAELKVQSEAEDIIARSKADAIAGQKAKEAAKLEDSFADVDEDEFDIQERAEVAAGKAFDNTLKELGQNSTLQTTDNPQLSKEFASIGRLFTANSQGRLPASVFNTRLASRLSNLRTRFPHHTSDINRFVTARLGFDPIKRELALQAKRDAAQIDLEKSNIDRVNKAVFEKPWLAGHDFASTERNVAQDNALQARLELRRKAISDKKNSLELRSTLQTQQGADIVSNYTALTARTMFGSLSQALQSGQDINQVLLKENANIIQSVAKGRLEVMNQLNSAGVTDPDARKAALGQYDEEMSAVSKMVKYGNLNDLVGFMGEAMKKDDVYTMLSGPDGLKFRNIQALTEITGGGQSWSTLTAAATQVLLKDQEFIEGVLKGRLNPTPKFFPSITTKVEPDPDAPKEERTLEKTSLQIGAKTVGGVADPGEAVTQANVYNLTTREESIIKDPDTLKDTARNITNPNYVKRAVKNASVNQIESLTRITAAGLVNVHSKLAATDNLAAKPIFRFDSNGHLQVTYDTNVNDTRAASTQSLVTRTLQPTINEANQLMDGYLSYMEKRGKNKDEVIKALQNRGLFAETVDDPDEFVPSTPEPATQIVQDEDIGPVDNELAFEVEQSGFGEPSFGLFGLSSALGEVKRSIDSLGERPRDPTQMEKDIEAIKARLDKAFEDFTQEGITKNRVKEFVEDLKGDQRDLTESIIEHEGLRLQIYKDSEGHPTIGVGHKLLPGEQELFKNGIDEEKAMALLEQDLQIATQQAETLPFYKDLNRVRKNVVTEMVFNLGLEGFKGFKDAIAAIENEQWTLASEEMLDSKWANQVGNRAKTLAKKMEKGRRT